MSFTDAVRTCLTQYATFSGRARRSEFWWFALFYVLVLFAVALIDQVVGDWFGVIVMLALIIPTFAVTWRRLHDTGRSGGWYFISLVPFVGPFIVLVFTLMDSEPGQNAYGPSPKLGLVQPTTN